MPNMFDIIFLGLLLIFFLLSYMRGAIKEMFTLLGLAGGFLAAGRFSDDLAKSLASFMPDHQTALLVSFLLIMLLCYFLGIFLGGMSDLFRRDALGPFNRMLGGLIGLTKGLILSLVVYWIVLNHFPVFHQQLNGSWMGDRLGNLLNQLQRMDLI